MVVRLSKKEIVSLLSKAKSLDPVVRVGKNGLTESVVTQVKKVLDKRGLIKIKFLRSFVEENDRKSASADLALQTRSTLISQVGFTVVLYKPVMKKSFKELTTNTRVQNKRLSRGRSS